jgi:hypothetical protein
VRKLRAVYRLIALRALCVCGLLLAGCGDDDDAPADGNSNGQSGKDGGARDAGSKPSTGRDAATADAGEPVPVCPTGECDLLAPGACDGNGQGCVFARGNADAGEPPAPVCAMVGSGAEGDACTASEDCGPGLDCSAFDGTGVCRSYCCALSRTADCPADQFCRLGLDPERKAFAVGLCDKCDDCDPLDPNACGSKLSCYPLPGSIECTACLPPGKRTPGEKCTLSTDCAKGAACFLLAPENSRCVEFCELDSDEPCSDSARKCSEVAGAKLPPGIALCL